MLYIVATPIGNLNDISQRAIDVLQSVDLILCEDTRHSKILLDALHINKKLMSYFAHNEAARSEQFLPKLCEGQKVALISDAGTPCISDPGMRIVKACHEAQIPVIPIPGACAAVSAVCACGIAHERFTFIGFYPRSSKDRRDLLIKHRDAPELVVGYESPRRLLALVEEIVETLGPGWELCLAREISKKFEEIRKSTASDLLEYLQSKEIRGEIVLILAPGAEVQITQMPAQAAALIEDLRGKVSDRDLRDCIAKAFSLRPKMVYEWILSHQAQ